jgi:hypothetical protein
MASTNHSANISIRLTELYKIILPLIRYVQSLLKAKGQVHHTQFPSCTLSGLEQETDTSATRNITINYVKM